MTKQQSTDSDPRDVVASVIDRALSPYAALPAGLRARICETMRDVLETHPVATTLVAQLAPPPVVLESGEVPTDGAVESTTREKGKAGGGAA